MTLKEHIYAIQNLLNKGVPSDDNRITNALVAHYLKISRASLLEFELNRYNKLPSFAWQTLCLKMKLVDKNVCKCIPIPTCKVWRSVDKIPPHISSIYSDNIQVFTLDNQVISLKNINAANYRKYGKIISAKPIAYIEDGYLYIENVKSILAVKLKLLLLDPTIPSATKMCDDNGEDLPEYCGTEENNFPIKSSLIPKMYEMTIAAVGMAKSAPQDITNDAADRTPQTNTTRR